MHAASRQALDSLRERLDEVLPSMADGAAHKALAAELKSAAGLLAEQPRLRRTLGDPATDSASRAELVRSLLGVRLGESAVDLVASGASQRWSTPWDLVDSIEILADDVLLAAAEQQGQLDSVEDELFRFERILASASQLVTALDESAIGKDRRIALLDSVLADKVNPITAELLRHAVSSSRKLSLQLAIDDLLQASAARRNRSVARVISAIELSQEQTSRLAGSLSEMYGRDISVRTAIDPAVMGGLFVRVGDEVIDGSIVSRLAAARTALAG
jgi:F-type H+-transporting ATPase subunit delta